MIAVGMIAHTGLVTEAALVDSSADTNLMSEPFCKFNNLQRLRHL